MSAFVISQKENGKYKYTFEHRRGKTLLTSIEYYSKETIQETILFLQTNFESVSFYKFKTPAGKLFFKLAIEDNIYATSRKFNTELRFEKGLEEVKRSFLTAELLDFSIDIFTSLENEKITQQKEV